MNGLYRTYVETEPCWSVVGPEHERLYFNHLDLVGYAPAKGEGFLIYAMNGEKPGQIYKTIPAAKRAAKRWLKLIIRELETLPITWNAEETGVHWTAKVKGFQVANYYKCDRATESWHAGFKIWFGGTFYVRDFSGVDDAKAAVSETWREWLRLARQHLLTQV